MTIEDVVKYFGNLHRVCILLNIAPPNMTHWKNQGYIPMSKQYKIQEITAGALMRDDEDPKVLRRNVRKELRAESNKDMGCCPGG